MAQSLADRTAEIVVERIEAMAQAVADAVLASPLMPDVAQPSQRERLAYFREMFFNPDGTPNAAGRQAVLDLHGAETYQEIALALVKEATRAD